MAQFDLALPKFTDGDLDDAKQRRKIMNYLYKLDEQLRFVLNNLDAENFTETFQQVFVGGGITADGGSVRKLEDELARLSTKIQQTASQIELKADAEELNELGDVVSQVESDLKVVAGKIESTVTQTEFDELGNKVSENTSLISQTAEDIRSEVSDVESDLRSEIAQTADGIRMEVGNIRVGGTNLIRKSQSLTADSGLAAADRWRLATGASTFAHDERFTGLKLYMTGATENTYVQGYSPVSLLPTGWLGRQVTLSAYIYSPDWSAVDASVRCSIRLSKGGTSVLNYGANTLVAAGGTLASGASTDGDLTSGKWVRISTTFTLDAEEISSGTGVLADNTHVYVSFSLYRNGDVRIYAPKLELGNKATDWSPAPEDTDDEFEEVRSEFSIEAGKIRSEVSSSVSGLQSQIDQTDGKIELAVNEVQVGGTNLLKHTRRLKYVYNSVDHFRYSTGATYYDHDDGFMRGQITASGQTADVWYHIDSPLVALPTGWQGRQVTVSAYIDSPNWAAVDMGVSCALQLSTGTTARTNYSNRALVSYNGGSPVYGSTVQADRPLANNKWLRVSMTFTLDAATLSSGTGTFDDNTHMFVVFWLRRNGDFRFYAPKLEWGNKATDWSPHPEEFSAGTNVLITKDEFRVTTSEFNVNITSEDGTENMLHIDKDGGYMNAFESPTVAPRYVGPGTLYVNPNATSAQVAAGNYFRSLKDAFAVLNSKQITKTININLAAGMTEYGNVQLKGTSGPYWIYINGDSSNRAKLVGKMDFFYNTTAIRLRYLNVDSSINARGIDVAASTYVEIAYCTVTGKGTAASVDGAINTASVGIFAEMHSGVQVASCELYDTYRSLYTQTTAEMQSVNNKGNCLIGANRTHLFVQGTAPCNSTTWTYSEIGGGKVWAHTDVTVDQGSKPTPETAPTTVSYSMTSADNYTMGNGSWTNYSDEDIRQGYTSANGMHRGCFWFNNTTIRSALSGKTIKQATLSLYQMSAGRSQPVQVNLEGITMNYSGRSGVPYGTQEYGVIGTTGGVGVTSTFTIPVKVITDLVAGTINGLMLRNDESSVMTGDDNSYHFARFAGGTTTAYRPVLTVTYQT